MISFPPIKLTSNKAKKVPSTEDEVSDKNAHDDDDFVPLAKKRRDGHGAAKKTDKYKFS